ncbi:U3 small nucleolar RNA-associated protein 18 homolog isoform X2 [Argiope bruennichi]|uniref:U3 small nucleolar RNA-associated protein 18 homolog isoform X2 n=1 Tax=Argiope bruennichi TaxID=94029 RepID=UPI0024957D87|nr:U3 small nucleolar RNA-associated protein 18 homolog isoform X2 [Argiope bruennichi]
MKSCHYILQISRNFIMNSMSGIFEKEQKKKKSQKKNIKEFKKKSDASLESHKDISKPLKRKESKFEEDVVLVKPKKLHSMKKKLVSELKEAQGILGATRPPDEKEKELQELLFGCNPEDLEEEHSDNKSDLEEPVVEETEKDKKKLAAWEDEDDETLLVEEKAKSLKNVHRSITVRGDEKYSNFVQEKFIKIMGNPKWAEQDNKSKDSGDESEDELLQKTGNFVKQSEFLPKGTINIRKTPSLVDPNMKASMIKSVEFHPTSRVAVVATVNGTANLFQIDGKINAKIQSIYFENFPVHTAHFSVDGTEVIVGSNKFVHFFSYDMLAGKISRIPWQKGMEQRNIRRFQMSPDGKYIVIHGRYGNIHLMSSKSKEWIGSLKMNGEVIATTFNNDGSKMYSHGDTGEVYVWDMSNRKCIHKFEDEGCITGTAITVSPNDQFLATGSDSGVVNIYDNSTIYNNPSPQPMKILLNLTTEITNLKFNSTSEILAMSSSFKAEALKLVHFPSMTVFSNFPVRGEFIKNPNSLDISVNSGYMCIGNNVGTAYIYRLKHYKNY